MSEEKTTKRYIDLIVGTSSFVLVAALLSKLINYVYKIVIARGLGPEVYGLFSLGLIVISVFSAIASFGLVEGVLRYASFYRGKRQNAKISAIMKGVVAITILTSIVSTVVLFIIAPFIAETIFKEPQLSYYLRILALSIPPAVLAGVYLSALRAFERVKTFSFLVNVFHNAIKLFLLVFFLFIMSKTNAILFSYSLSFVGLFVVAYIVYKVTIYRTIAKDRELEKDKRRELILTTLSFSWPLIFTSLLAVLFFWTDSFFLGYYLDAVDVGVYNAAVTLAGLFTIAQDLFMQLFLPLISKELARKREGVIQELSKQIFKWIVIINVPLLISLVILPGPIINFFFGAAYLGAASSLRVLAIGALFSSFTSLSIGLINMKGKTKSVLMTFVIFTLLNALFDVMLVPVYGLQGAAIATTIAWLGFSATLMVLVRKNYGFFPVRRKVLRVLLVALVPAAMLYVASQYLEISNSTLIILGLLFAVVYVGLVVITRCLDYNDLEAIRSARRRVTHIAKKTMLRKKL